MVLNATAATPLRPNIHEPSNPVEPTNSLEATRFNQENCQPSTEGILIYALATTTTTTAATSTAQRSPKPFLFDGCSSKNLPAEFKHVSNDRVELAFEIQSRFVRRPHNIRLVNAHLQGNHAAIEVQRHLIESHFLLETDPPTPNQRRISRSSFLSC